MLLQGGHVTFYSSLSAMQPTPPGNLCSYGLTYVYANSYFRNTVNSWLPVKLMVLHIHGAFCLWHFEFFEKPHEEIQSRCRGYLGRLLRGATDFIHVW